VTSNTGSTIQALIHRWHVEAETLENRYKDERGAFLVGRMARELEDALREHSNEPLTLEQASIESGYSADHIGRQLRDGKLPNVGRLHSPRVRRCDLPIKSSHLRDGMHDAHFPPSKTQIARSVVNRE